MVPMDQLQILLFFQCYYVFVYHMRVGYHSMMCHLNLLFCPRSFKETINIYVTVRNKMKTKETNTLSKKKIKNDVKVGVFTSREVGRGFEPRSDQTKDYKIDICCFSVKYAASKSKRKNQLARNRICLREATYLFIDSCFSELAL